MINDKADKNIASMMFILLKQKTNLNHIKSV